SEPLEGSLAQHSQGMKFHGLVCVHVPAASTWVNISMGLSALSGDALENSFAPVPFDDAGDKSPVPKSGQKSRTP
ncbi:MAG: hypothetical protein LBD01_03230, partial [Puniceicoccales bacterium]|nr:hypothetical protein [Puniceicoccales bacterium]